MLSKIFARRPRHAVVVAYLALFVALGGSSAAEPVRDAAKKLITGKQIKDGSVGEKDLNRALRAKLGGVGAQGGPAGPAGPAGPEGPAGPKGDTGTVDTSNFYDKAASDSRFLNVTGKASDSDRLDGLDSAALKAACPNRAGIETVYIGAGTCLAKTRDTFTSTWYQAQNWCHQLFGKGRLATYDELLRGARYHSVALVANTWTADSAGDDQAIFINSTSTSNADGVALRASTMTGQHCAWETVNGLGAP